MIEGCGKLRYTVLMVTNIDSFLQLSQPEQSAIEMKVVGTSHASIVLNLEREFDKKFAQTTVDHWFAKTGKLAKPLSDYRKYCGETAIEDSAALAKLATREAFKTIRMIMNTPDGDPRVKLQAARVALQVTAKMLPK